MSKHEAALIILTVCFALLALLFLIIFIARRAHTKSGGTGVLVAFLVCTAVAVYFGFSFGEDAYSCKKCGNEAIYSTGFGKYCAECFQEEVNRSCCRCGRDVTTYVIKGGDTYCKTCATIEFGYTG